jgi:endoglucanase
MRQAAALALAFLCLLPAASRAADSDVRVNTIGYVPERAKRASVLLTATAFDVKKKADGSVALHGALVGPVTDPDTGQTIWTADFSALADEGDYYVDVPGVGRSPDFPIGRASYQSAMLAAMLGFYGWRCNTAVSLSWQGATFQHGACHMDDAHTDYVATAGTRDGKKGWHDAGDYGKYVPNAAATVGLMLQAWEDFGAALGKMKLPIPETGGATPDYLAEIRWELDWVLEMQYGATDGRVSHKLTSKRFDVTDYVFVMPENDLMTRYFTPAGTLAAADFVAMMAKAARVFAPFDAVFAKACLDAAKVSYAYLAANPAYVNAERQARNLGFVTGGYEANDASDRLWAAAELWETTGDAAALADYETRVMAVKSRIDVGFDWGKMGTLGSLVYLRSQRTEKSPAVVAALEADLIGTADFIVTNTQASGYGRGLGANLYWWGSNGSVPRICAILETAYSIAGNPAHLDACLDQLGWIFGRNDYDRSFVTGLGRNPPAHPGHRMSDIDGVVPPWPGLLVGGPTDAAGKNWVDDHYAWDKNEVAINWNGALAYALAAMLEPAPLPPVDEAGTRADATAEAADGTAEGHASPAGDGLAPVDDAQVELDEPTQGPPAQPVSAAAVENSGGCGCRAAGVSGERALSGLLLAALLLARRRQSVGASGR